MQDPWIVLRLAESGAEGKRRKRKEFTIVALLALPYLSASTYDAVYLLKNIKGPFQRIVNAHPLQRGKRRVYVTPRNIPEITEKWSGSPSQTDGRTK